MTTPVVKAVPFDMPFAARVFVGAGVAGLAASELERAGVTRPGVVTTRSVAATDMFQQWLAGLPSAPPVFSATRPHTPRETVIAAANYFREYGCDGFVSFGGGSAIDTAKGITLALAGKVEQPSDFDRFKGEWGKTGSFTAFTIDGRMVPHVAIPTTLSGGAHTFGAGITDAARGEKFVHRHPGLGIRAVLLDPLVTLATPDSLWTGTGMKALDHAVEGLYSSVLPPFAEPLRARAFRILMSDLVDSIDRSRPDLIERRARVLAASGMSTVSTFPLGISHALGHQAGAAWGVAHAHTTPIFLPVAVEFNAPAAPAAMRAMAAEIGLQGDDAGALVAERIRAMVKAVGLPGRLRDAGVKDQSLFEEVAAATLRDSIMFGNPREATVAEVVGLLQRAY